MIGIVYSDSDTASLNIKKFLPKKGKFCLIRTSNALTLECSGNYELLIFVSKHESSGGVKSLTCHTPGNYGKAEFGGKTSVLSYSNALIQSLCLKKLAELNKSRGWDFSVGFEATHHGPSLDVPCLFVELGSSGTEWNNREYCSGIAGVVAELVNKYGSIMKGNGRVCVGIGGSHYAPAFSKLAMEKGFNFGHICPKYTLNLLDKGSFRQMISKTVPEPSTVVIDKSVNSKKRKEVIKWCGELGLSAEALK
ncbi:hypothetical protein COX58_02530 [archaeon CG_4_10_14_0_2_um_filter_Archaea_38_6]|nr:MAG: hypothetical protein COS83_01765 [archaeon CG07_land_8_20_14_0_80_38_8]PIU88869.1 MAG: hypothetical protein COS64_02260 [archaeon CG06_land_8_20_14_3_00_37_11]PIX43423.1 MAG: hypothetical protein COZ55_01270 [archaeon CG_4_8_14_3_um_filter_38_5]PJA22300.1 MAG: hypothetical protein COX58_02530 [archaeon CG_4_10_14_0_2_um_filter_Archaea_38_6]